ncbi:MAG: peptidoglycan-binding protein [Clostridia bacterium]|nr:peptidoglycan-binding protein [Clostridia bacterium]
MTEKQKAIYEAQGYLRNISRAFGEIPLLIPDGIFGEETEKTVLAFQKKQGLEETGIINYETWTAIVDENDRAFFISSDSLLIANEEFPLRRGMQSGTVAHLNTMLQRLGESYGNFSTIEVSDVFDAETERNVKQWQRVIRTEETGEVDKLTWERLVEWYVR